ncbi:hypothetical protein WMF31_28160 [Sorangium sp. So ce1036]|uniref:hypothetical protein n=1 Tax=Sorangium sp. So ce1036 TaxID=3133328 RepID=UPI003EFCF838
MEAKLEGGHIGRIVGDGSRLEIVDSGGAILFTLSAPAHAVFYLFAVHAVHGECPVVSFDPDHAINGWMDWYYRVDIESRSMERLNPWR